MMVLGSMIETSGSVTITSRMQDILKPWGERESGLMQVNTHAYHRHPSRTPIGQCETPGLQAQQYTWMTGRGKLGTLVEGIHRHNHHLRHQEQAICRAQISQCPSSIRTVENNPNEKFNRKERTRTRTRSRSRTRTGTRSRTRT